MNAYVTKFSSGTILALLAFSGLLVLAPAVTPVHAATAPVVGFNTFPGSLWGQTSEPDFNFNFTSALSNTATITQVSINAPAGWSFTGCNEWGPYIFNTCNDESGQTETWTPGSGGFPFPPGGSQDLEAFITWPTGASYPITGTFTTSFESGGVSYPGPNIVFHAFDPLASTTPVMKANGATGTFTYTAGGAPVTITANIGVADAGVPVTFKSEENSGSFSGTGVTCHFSYLCWVSTDSSGVATITFQPANSIASLVTPPSDNVVAVFGNTIFCDGSFYGLVGDDADCNSYGLNTLTVTTVAGAPTKLAFAKAGAFATSTSLHYETAPGMPSGVAHNEAETNPGGAACASDCVSFSIADKFGNPISFAASSPGKVTAMTITATSANGIFDLGGSVNKTSVVCGTDFACPTSGSSLKLPFPYFQSPAYGSQGIIAATATVDGVGLSGSSGTIFTSTFDTAANTPTDTDAGSSVAAGGTTTVKQALTLVQANVPIALFAYNTTGPYVGSWAGSTNAWDSGAYNITTLATSSTGKTSDKFTIDTHAGMAVDFKGAIWRPTDGGSSWVISAGATGLVTTKAGPAAGILVGTFFDNALTEPTSNAFSGATIYVNASLVDAYGNDALNTGVAQIQVTLTAGAGTLSATTVYIAPAKSDTFTSFGSIQWTTAGTAPTTTTLKASAVVAGSPASNTETLNLVTKAPTLTVTSSTGTTVSSVIYTHVAAVGFNLKAHVSKGYDPALGVNFAAAAPAGVWYQVDSHAWALAASSATGSISTGYTVIFSSGLHTVNFMANDSNGNNSPMVSFKVLVDAAAPDVNFGTAKNANLSAPASVTATIVDKEGDLNATSVSATGNSTKALTVAVTGTNNPGSSVSYSVTITGLTTGTWNIALSGSDLAGNSNSSSITVHVIVPYAQSLVVSGTPSLGTLGGYSGINVAYQNLNPTSQNVVIFAVWKNSLGQTAGIGAGSATIGAGATTSAFIVEPVGLAAGTYSVNLFVFTTSNNPVSITTTISVTV